MLKLWRECHSLKRTAQAQAQEEAWKRASRWSQSPHGVPLASFLRSCAKTKALLEGRHAHAYIITHGHEHSLLLANLLLHMYGICGALEEVHCLFSRMHQLDLFSWNFAIKAHALHGHHIGALHLVGQMLHQGFLPDKFIFITLFTALTHQTSLKAGMRMHACMYGSEVLMDVAVHTALITMYGNCGQLEHAQREFNSMSHHDSVSWTAMIATCAQHGKGSRALFLFDHMMLQGLLPDLVTFVSALDACAGHGSLAKAKQIHTHILSCSFEGSVVIGTALVNMYGKCGSPVDAHTMFYKMHERNVVSWNALIGSYSQNGKSQDSLLVFGQMLQEGTLPNKVTFVNTFDACGSAVAIATGKKMHACIMGSAFKKDIVIQTSLVNFYGKCGWFSHACRVYENMSERDDVTLISIISACANCAALSEGKQLHEYIICNASESNIVLGTALINMYSKCGSIEDAQRVFDRMPKRNVISWNAIIAAYCQNGLGKQSLSLYEKMCLDNVKPTSVTFLSVLSACSHAGLLKEGCRCFDDMRHNHEIMPNVDHYNCMIDLFGRIGRLVEAEELIVNMPLEPSVVSWTTLLSACRKEVDVVRGERAAFRLFNMNPEDTVPYVMLANTYAAAGRGDDAEKVMARMREKGLKRMSGQCLIEVDGRINAFVVNDQLHPQKEEIYAELQRLIKSVEGVGSALKANIVPHGLEDKEHRHCTHSEMLAVAFGLISIPSEAPLFITKNIQVCSECHSIVKSISMISGREIIIKDSGRIHRFRGGICSCADSWYNYSHQE